MIRGHCDGVETRAATDHAPLWPHATSRSYALARCDFEPIFGIEITVNADMVVI